MKNCLQFMNYLLKLNATFAYKHYLQKHHQSFIGNYKNAKKILVAFDFDHTIVDENSDTVASTLVPEDSLKSARKVYNDTSSWTLNMKEIFHCLHKCNITEEQILCAIKNIPPVRCMDALLNYLSDSCFEVIVLSDSNSVFINEWIRSFKLENIIKKVVTNPAWFDDTGLLNIEFYQNQSFCHLCGPNLCKGYALQTFISDRKINNVVFERVIFIGDGSNDFCPTLKLSKNDLVFPRFNYALFKKIKQNEDLVKAEVIPWKDGSDVIRVFQERLGLNVN